MILHPHYVNVTDSDCLRGIRANDLDIMFWLNERVHRWVSPYTVHISFPIIFSRQPISRAAARRQTVTRPKISQG